MSPLKSLGEEFLTYLEVERHVSPNTVRAYGNDMRWFLRFLAEREIEASVESVTPQLLRDYLVWLEGRHLSVTTIRRYFDALRSLWNYLCDWHDVTQNPFRRISLPKPPQNPPVFLTPAEVQRLIKATEDTRFVVRGIRDRAVITLMVCTGVRRQEALNLQLTDIDLKEGVLRVENGKGKRGPSSRSSPRRSRHSRTGWSCALRAIMKRSS